MFSVSLKWWSTIIFLFEPFLMTPMPRWEPRDERFQLRVPDLQNGDSDFTKMRVYPESSSTNGRQVICPIQYKLLESFYVNLSVKSYFTAGGAWSPYFEWQRGTGSR